MLDCVGKVLATGGSEVKEEVEEEEKEVQIEVEVEEEVAREDQPQKSGKPRPSKIWMQIWKNITRMQCKHLRV